MRPCPSSPGHVTHGQEKSDLFIVALKPANKPGRLGAELAEPRERTEGNTGEQHTCRTLRRVNVSQRLDCGVWGATETQKAVSSSNTGMRRPSSPKASSSNRFDHIKDFRNPLEDIISGFLALPGHLPQTTGRKRGCRNARLQVSLPAKVESQQVGRMDHSRENPS
jgi:hypothetical protein